MFIFGGYTYYPDTWSYLLTATAFTRLVISTLIANISVALLRSGIFTAMAIVLPDVLPVDYVELSVDALMAVAFAFLTSAFFITLEGRPINTRERKVWSVFIALLYGSPLVLLALYVSFMRSMDGTSMVLGGLASLLIYPATFGICWALLCDAFQAKANTLVGWVKKRLKK